MIDDQVTLANQEITQFGQLVACVNTPEFPVALLKFVQSLFPVDNVVTLGFSPHTCPIELFREFPEQAGIQFSRLYAQGAYLLDPFYQVSIVGKQRGLFSIKETAPDRFFQSEYYHSYYCKLPLIDEICLIYSLSDEWSLAYSLARGPQLGSYTEGEIERLARLEPLLGSLIVKHWGESVLNNGRSKPLGDIDETAMRIFVFAFNENSKGISKRESEVAALILRGHSSYSISQALSVSVNTVKVFRRRLYRKLQISTQNELYTKLFPAIINH